jgi:hypothetical protein
MIPYRPWSRAVIPAAFGLGVYTSVSCLFFVCSFRNSPRKLVHFAGLSASDGPHLGPRVAALEVSPSVAERTARCRIHGTAMKSVLVPVKYGLPPLNERLIAYLTAEKDPFPHNDDPIEGGCFVQSIQEELKDVCQECNAARDRWLRGHPATMDP